MSADNLLNDKLKEFLWSYKIGIGLNFFNDKMVQMFLEIKYVNDMAYYYEYDNGKLKNHIYIISYGFNL